MKSVGIDIGTSSIKVIELQLSSKGFSVANFMEHPLGNKSSLDLDLEIIDFLRTVSAQYPIDQTRFTVCVRQDRMVSRFKHFPFNDRQKVLKSLPFELEEEIPFAPDQAVFDAKVIKYVGNTAEVLACAAPSQQVADLVKKMNDALISPHIVTAEGVAFANILERWFDSPPQLPEAPPKLEDQGEEPRSLKIVLNMGHTRTLVCAFEGHQLVGVRSILWGTKTIAESLAKKYEIPPFEAVKELQNKAFILPSKDGAAYDQIVFSDLIAFHCKDLARDLRLTLLDFKAELNGNVQEVLLTGGASGITNLNAFLTMHLEVPVNTFNPFENIQQPFLFERTDKFNSTFSVAFGLAIEGIKKPKNPALTFLRGEFAKQSHFFKNLWNSWGHTIQIAGAALVVFFIFSSLRESFALNLADRTQEALKTQAKAVAKLTGAKANEANIKKFIREQKKKALDLKTLSGLTSMNSSVEILKKINDASPAKNLITLDVKKFDVQDQLVRIEGTVANNSEVSLLEKALNNVAVDGKVNAESPTITVSPGKTAFAFSLVVDRGVKTAKKE